MQCEGQVRTPGFLPSCVVLTRPFPLGVHACPAQGCWKHSRWLVRCFQYTDDEVSYAGVSPLVSPVSLMDAGTQECSLSPGKDATGARGIK